MTRKNHFVERILAVLAAICLVGAFALSMLVGTMTSLARLISMINHDFLVAVQDGVRADLSAWAWNAVCVPLLARPSWLPLLGLALIFGGAALTISSRRGGLPGAPRWRN